MQSWIVGVPETEAITSHRARYRPTGLSWWRNPDLPLRKVLGMLDSADHTTGGRAMAQQYPVTADEATEALDAASRAQRAVRSAERNWPVVYLAAFGVAMLAVFPMIGLLGAVGVGSAMAVWVALIAVMVGFAGRQRVTSRGRGRVIGVSFAVWAVVYGALLLVGEIYFPGRPAYWLPMALVAAAPLLVGAFWARRR